MSNLYEMLAIYRNNFRAHSEEEAREIVSVIEKIYDVANTNRRDPGNLPWFFYLYNVNMRLDVLEKVIKDIGINAEVNLIDYDVDNGAKYQIVMIY